MFVWTKIKLCGVVCACVHVCMCVCARKKPTTGRNLNKY